MEEIQESETGMKKKKWAVRVLAALGLGMALVLVNRIPGEMQGKRTPEETVKLVLANNQSENSCTTAAVEQFAGQVRGKTGGRMEISVYNDRELGDVMSSLEQPQYGAVDIMKADVSAMSNYVGEHRAFLMSYIYQGDTHFWKVHNEEIGVEILRDKQMEEQNMYGLCYYDGDTRCFCSTRKGIHTPKDVKGMLARIQKSRVMMSMVRALKVQPMTIPYSEIYSSLQLSGMDVAENPIVNYLGQSHYQTAPYFMEDNRTRPTDTLVMNEKSGEELSKADLDIIDEVAEESCECQKKLRTEAERQTRKALEEKGVTITKLSEEEMQEFHEIYGPIWYSYGKGKYNDLVDRIVAAGI